MSDDPDGKGDRFDTRAAQLLTYFICDLEADLSQNMAEELQDEIAAAIRHEAVTAERLSAANTELLEALKSLINKSDDYRLGVKPWPTMEFVPDERPLLDAISDAQAIIAKHEGSEE